MGGYRFGTRWTDELVKEKILEVSNALSLDSFPTQKQMYEVTGNHALTSAIRNRGGIEKWSEITGLSLGERQDKEVKRRIYATCKHCGKTFWQYKSNCEGKPKYCSSECYHTASRKVSYGTCEWCGKTFKKHFENHPQRFCCLECSLEYKRKQRYEHRFESGYVNEYGYRVLCFNGICIPEHIYLMEEKIGRKLNKDECVHHIDGCRSNNNIDNLMLLTKSEHSRLHRLQDIKEGKPLFGREK